GDRIQVPRAVGKFPRRALTLGLRRAQYWHPPAPALSQAWTTTACLLRVQARAGYAGLSIGTHLCQLCRRRGLRPLASCESKQEPAMPGSVLEFSCARVVAAVDYARLPPASPSKSRLRRAQ